MSPATAKMAGTARLARMKHDVTADKRSQGADGGPADGGRSAPVAAKAAAINAAQQRPLTPKTVIKRALVVAVAGLAIYLVLPRLASVLGSWPRLSTLSPIWFSVAIAAELASFTCNFALQRLALQTKGWFAVVTAGLAGNAVTNSLPGGDAAGAAVQFGMLTTAGFDTDTAVGALTTFSLLGRRRPAGAAHRRPAHYPGRRADQPWAGHTALLGIAGFVLFAIFGTVLLYTNGTLTAVGRAAQGVRNWFTHGRCLPMTGLDKRLLTERDTIRTVLGEKWWQAALLTTGRLGFDYGCLLAALRATGASPRPSLVLLAYSAAGIVGLFPLTPGGLGVVEASLSGLLILAASTPATPSWPPWPTGSPPTGSPRSPDRRLSCSGSGVEDIGWPGSVQAMLPLLATHVRGSYDRLPEASDKRLRPCPGLSTWVQDGAGSQKGISWLS